MILWNEWGNCGWLLCFFLFFLWIIFELLYCYNLSLENFIKSAFLTFFRCAADRAPRPNKRSSCLQIQVPIVSGTVRTGQRNRSSCGKWFRARGHFWPYLRTYAPEAWGNLRGAISTSCQQQAEGQSQIKHRTPAGKTCRQERWQA